MGVATAGYTTVGKQNDSAQPQSIPQSLEESSGVRKVAIPGHTESRASSYPRTCIGSGRINCRDKNFVCLLLCIPPMGPSRYIRLYVSPRTYTGLGSTNCEDNYYVCPTLYMSWHNCFSNSGDCGIACGCALLFCVPTVAYLPLIVVAEHQCLI